MTMDMRSSFPKEDGRRAVLFFGVLRKRPFTKPFQNVQKPGKKFSYFGHKSPV